MTGEQRREQLLKVATQEFAARGLHGTSAETIARQAGITQPYLFRIFGTKVGLFTAVIEQVYQTLTASFEAAAEGLTGEKALIAMGGAYREQMRDGSVLLLVLHGFAACNDPDVRQTVRTGFSNLWHTVEKQSGLPARQVKSFMSLGMLLNDSAAMDLENVDEQWARDCLAPSIIVL